MSDSGAEGQPDSSEEEESQTFVADVVHFGKSYKGLTGLFSACLGGRRPGTLCSRSLRRVG